MAHNVAASKLPVSASVKVPVPRERAIAQHANRGIAIIALCASVFAHCAVAQHAKIHRIGYLAGSSAPTAADPDPNADAFRQGLRDLGYIEGNNIRIEYRYS